MPVHARRQHLNYLYMNSVIDKETKNETDYYVKSACPFIQKRLINDFSRDFFKYIWACWFSPSKA